MWCVSVDLQNVRDAGIYTEQQRPFDTSKQALASEIIHEGCSLYVCDTEVVDLHIKTLRHFGLYRKSAIYSCRLFRIFTKAEI